MRNPILLTKICHKQNPHNFVKSSPGIKQRSTLTLWIYNFKFCFVFKFVTTSEFIS